MAHDERQRPVKLYNHLVVRAERPDPLDQHLHGICYMALHANIHDARTDPKRTLSIVHMMT